MFREYKCGCIDSAMVGRVRFCSLHRPETATGDGASGTWVRKGDPKHYPAHGVWVPGWTGK